MSVVPGRTERRVFVDSSAYLALLDRRDGHHDEAVQVLRALADERARQFTTNVILMEAHSLILSTGGIRAGHAFLRSTGASNTTIVRVRASDEARAREIVYQYDDKDFSLVDAISFTVMERLDISRAFTFDRHFVQFGFSIVRPSRT